MGWARAALGLVAVMAAAALLVSGGSEADPQTPRGLPGMPPPFLGTANVGDGGLTAAIDAYGDVVDLRVPGPAGRALIDNPADRQAAGTVPAGTGIVPWISVGGRPAQPLWKASSITQRYRPGTDVLVTSARFGAARVRIVYAAAGSRFACLTEAGPGTRVSLRSTEPAAARRLRCDDEVARRTIRAAERDDRRWLQRARPLGGGSPPWAKEMYERSLLMLRTLADRRTGAVAAGARDGWAYVWPRDAATAAIAFAKAGYQAEAERSTRFLLGLALAEAARFHGNGSPVPGRPAQGDAIGWVAAATRAARLTGSARHAARIPSAAYPAPWRDRADYQEGEPGDFLGNAIAAGEPGTRIGSEFGTSGRLGRKAGGGGGLDSAAAWAVRPFPRPFLFAPVRRTLLQLARRTGAHGLLPGRGWTGGEDRWSAPTAWTAWSLAALGERAQALRLMRALRRDSTPAGALPERVDARAGIPRSTTPLAWSHALAILALRELWPSRTASNSPSGR